MFGHVTVGGDDLRRLARFYDAALAPLGLRRHETNPDGGPPAECWVRPGEALPRFYVHVPFDGRLAAPGNGCMVAFLAPSPETVKEAHGAGGADEGAPGERPHYGRGYCGAYRRDPEGNKLHPVHRGDLAAGK